MSDQFVLETMRDDLVTIRDHVAATSEMLARLDERVRVSAEDCAATGRRLVEVERKVAWIRAWATGAGVAVTLGVSAVAWALAELPGVLR